MNDVAARAGVSVGTVSHVFNETARVSPALRESVLKAARELDYQPNLVAKSLRISQTKTIGMIVSNLENPFYTEIAHAIQDEVAEHDYDVIVASNFENATLEAKHISSMRRKQVDGMILAPTAEVGEVLDSLVRSGFPVVLVSKRVPGVEVPAVISDNRSAVQRATEHLLAQGRKRVGLVLHEQGGSHTEDQRSGYQAALKARGMRLEASRMALNRNTMAGGAEATARLMAADPPPDAIVCGTAMMTLGLLRYLSEHTIRCPEDVGLISSGNMPWGRFIDPPLTYITQPTHEMGKKAVQMLLEIVEAGRKPPGAVTVLQCGFHHGQSCGCEPVKGRGEG